VNDSRWTNGAIVALLVLVVAALYGRTSGFAAQHGYDDDEYVYANPHVLGGLTVAGIGWATTAYHAANWHPLTWMSHMTDVSLTGTDPGHHHLVNAGIHALNTAVLFLGLRAATGACGPSAIVAALFAVHPLNAESVAWISQRKSVLSTLFLFLAIGAYVSWTRNRGVLRRVLVVLLLALGLLAKPMLVTAPMLLLILDVWPLGRLERWADLRPRLMEKVPLFAVAAGSIAATLLAQRAGGALADSTDYPLGERVANALVATVMYLRDAAWPTGLACFYPHPASLGERTSLLAAGSCALALIAITALVVAARRSRPWLLSGWTWYLVALAPVIGLVQVGSQSRADRYTYVPMIGIFVAVVWEIASRVGERQPARRVATLVAAVTLGVFTALAFLQIGTWRNGETLNAHALRVTKRNWLAANNLGIYRLNKDDMAGALAAFRDSARLKPDYEKAYYNEGLALNALARYPEAVEAFRRNLELAPDNTDGWDGVGYALVALHRYPQALKAFEVALSQRPDDPIALHGAGAMHLSLGDPNGALPYLSRLERVDRERAAELRSDMGLSK
jgi:tetratricopeptide (TPR) repeat protein